MDNAEYDKLNTAIVASTNMTSMAKFLIVLGECPGSRDGSVGIATSYRLDGRGSIPGRDKKLLSSTQRPDRP
jgi:hypothetical protein